MDYKDENRFDEVINISSNIRANKNAIIGRFDVRDLMFILIAILVGISLISILLILLSVKNIFVVLLFLSVFEIPILSLGFLKVYNIPMLDYIKMKLKSDNSVYRRQSARKAENTKEKYLIVYSMELNSPDSLSTTFSKLEEALNKLHKSIPFKNFMIKIMLHKLFIVIDIRNNFNVDYKGFLRFMRIDSPFNYVSIDGIKNYEIWISTLKFIDKKYNRQQIKKININKEKIKKLENINSNPEKSVNITNDLKNLQDYEYIKILKIVLYKYPFNIECLIALNTLGAACSLTSYFSVVEDKIYINKLDFTNTFINFAGSKEEIENAYGKAASILALYNIMAKEIKEENAKNSLMFFMENNY